MTQIGLMLEGQEGLNWERWTRILTAAEDLGYQCVFRSDHFTLVDDSDLDSLEMWTSLTFAATHTKRVEFGPLVTPVTFRHPSMNVRYAAAVDDLSDGRLIYGMGAGWNETEHKMFGVPFYDFPTRFAMLTEALEVTRLLMNSTERVSFTGKHYALDDALLRPLPKREGGPTLLVGGNGPKRTLPLAAEYADEWNAVFIERDLYKERSALLDDLLTEKGREPASVKRSLMTQVVYGKDDAALKARIEARGTDVEAEKNKRIIGTGQQVVDEIGKWVEAGVERFMLQWLDLDDMDGIESLAKDVLPHFHTS